jgi:molecular chaperone HscB
MVMSHKHMTLTHFERLGLPWRFSLHRDDLERAYLERSRESHPDFHTLASPDEQAESLSRTAALNEAYLTLKDPFRRAEYLLHLLGGPTASQHKQMPQAFLMEMMDLREQLEEAQRNLPELDKLELALEQRSDSLLQEIERELSREPVDPVRVRERLNAAKVVRGLLRDLRSGKDDAS